MRYLIDTHVMLWWLADHPRLGPGAREILAAQSSDVFVSVASLWEIAVKVRVGKLDADAVAIARDVEREGFVRLPIADGHLQTLATLPSLHRDPFDHMLIAQAMTEGATLLSADTAFAGYPVEVMRV